jgi:polysaccharide pyruvyl transferase WcaK-like protein
MDRPFRVGISGSYGGLNLGDEAILEGILRELRAAVPVEITVFSRNPDDTLKRHGVERALPVRDMSREQVRSEIERLDLFVLGGGGILFDAEVGIYLREVLLAHEAEVPVLVYAISAGPLERSESRTAVKEALDRAAIISVRERPSQHLLESIGVQQEIHITADPALLLEPQPLPEDALEREGIERQGQWLVGVSVREPGVAAPIAMPTNITHCSPTPSTIWSSGLTPTWSSCRWKAGCSTFNTATRCSRRWPTPTGPAC